MRRLAVVLCSGLLVIAACTQEDDPGIDPPAGCLDADGSVRRP